ncbi:MAG: NADH-quinone oxidoreductase subunit NuoG [Pyrinomonadaceae bacterium]
MSPELVKVTINGQEFEVPKGAQLIEVCREKGFGIPSFCYYSDLALQASCRMCLVRIEKMPKLQTSCTITCTDGMIVTTQSEEIEKAQRAMSEFLLANHPLDCPVCDRGGECELQEMIFDWGGLEERFTERKNAYPEKYLSPMVANDQQRCILCKRCTRVCDEWMGEEAIEAGSRGVNTVIGTYDGWLNCSQCGNCIEVCPTGTLLDATYRHESRPWELDQTVSTCTYCSDGCQLSVGSRGGDVLRVVARDRYVNGINGEFLCARGRFAHHFVNDKERVKTPLVRYKKGGRLIPTTWDEAIRFVAMKLNEVFETSGKDSIGFIGSPRLTNESLFTLKKFANEVVENQNYAIADANNWIPFFANLSAPLATHKDIRHAKTILMIGGNPKERQPFTDKQILQAVRNGGANLIVVNDVPIRTARRASQFVHLNPDSYDAFFLALADAENVESAVKKLGVESSELQAVRDTVNATQGDVVIILGDNLSAEALAIAAQLPLHHAGQKVLLHPLPLYNNSVGAVDMIGGGRPVADVVKNSRALYIAGSLLPQHLNESDLSSKDFVVVQELFETAATEFADVVLPAASFAEQDGTFTNNDGLVQRVRQAIAPVHQAKPDWMILSLLAKEFGVDFGYNMAATIAFKQIADSNSAYSGLRYPSLKDESNPVQVKHEIFSKNELSTEIELLKKRVETLPEIADKIMAEPAVGSELHVPGTLTGKTPEFAYLWGGNEKPENVLVSPLYQIQRNGKLEEMAVAAD